MTSNIIVIGIDPGLISTGYGILKRTGSSTEALDWGCICPPTHLALEKRLFIIKSGLAELISTFLPTVLATETQYVCYNVKSALLLSMVRAIALVTAAERDLPVHEYSPTKIKKACTGQGLATKQQMGYFVAHRLNITPTDLPNDAADALAIALCHLNKVK